MAKKSLYLHIGFNKTGSTSIQRDLAANAEQLAARGVLYPANPKEAHVQRRQHVPLAAALADVPVHWMSRQKRATLDQAPAAFRAAVQASSAEKIILSSEGFGELSVTPKAAARVAEALSDFDVRVIAYIRRQDSYFLSTYQEGVKGGRTQPFDFDSYPQNKWMHFGRRLAPWRKAFGPGRVIVRPFEPSFWPGRELFRDFLAAAQIPSDGLVMAPPKNESLDFRAVELLRRLNAAHMHQDSSWYREHRHPLRLQLMKVLESRKGAAQLLTGKAQRKMSLSPEQAGILRDYFRQENSRALEGTGIDPDAFFPLPQPGTETRIAPAALDEALLLDVIAGLTAAAITTDSNRGRRNRRRKV